MIKLILITSIKIQKINPLISLISILLNNNNKNLQIKLSKKKREMVGHIVYIKIIKIKNIKLKMFKKALIIIFMFIKKVNKIKCQDLQILIKNN